MSIRVDAIAAGLLTYNSGRPCKLGHTTDRYASNGMCIACLEISNAARKGAITVAKIKRNTALFSQLREHKFMINNGNLEMFEQLGEICQYSPSTVVEHLRKVVHELHLQAPCPRILKRSDLMEFMHYEGGKVLNIDELELHQPTDQDKLLVIRNGNRYNAEECMEVLRGQRLSVGPVSTIKPPIVLPPPFKG